MIEWFAVERRSGRSWREIDRSPEQSTADLVAGWVRLIHGEGRVRVVAVAPWWRKA